MSCNSCRLDKPIVNKKYDLCDDCNYMRLHNGQSKAEVAREKASNKIATLPKIYVFKTKKRLSSNQKTQKQQVIDKALQLLKESIRLDAKQSDSYYCKGCGKTERHLDCSHILSVKHRKDLELVRENINLFCRQCHIDWESGDILKMIALHSFEKDLAYMKENDPGRYNKLLDAIIYLVVHIDVIDPGENIEQKAIKIAHENDFIIK